MPRVPCAPGPRLLRLVGVRHGFADLKPRHEARAGLRQVPVAGDLHGIGLGQDGIEDRLRGQARREASHAVRLDLGELFGADGAVGGDGFGLGVGGGGGVRAVAVTCT